MSPQTTLRLGANEAGPVALDLETLLETRLMVTATSGGGKSGAVFQLCEVCAPHVQVIVLDPEGEFAPLRAKFPFVLAGPDGETPASVKTAAMLATLLLTEKASAIIDLYELPAAQRHEYVRDFLTAMVDAPKDLWHPVIVIVDEAHVFNPEKGQGESVAAEAMMNMATRGRKRGFCLVPATQRLAMISKTMAANCQNVLIGRTSQIDLDRALKTTLQVTEKEAKERIARELTRMPVGRFYAYGMAFAAAEPVEFQVDRAATLPEKKRGVVSLGTTPTPESIRSLLPQLADLPQESEKKAKTEEELRRELGEAQRRIREMERVAAVPNTVAPGLSDEERETLRMLSEKIEELAADVKAAEQDLARMRNIWSKAGALVAELLDLLPSEEDESVAADSSLLDTRKAEVAEMAQSVAAISSRYPAQSKAEKRVPTPNTVRGKAAGSSEKMSKAVRSILTVLAQHGECSRNRVAALANYTASGGSFGNALGECRTKGWLVGSDLLAITDEGMTALGDYEALPTGAELLALWLAKLSKAQREIVKQLARRGKPMMRDELAVACGYEASGGSYGNALGSLRTLQLIHGSKDIALHPDFAAAIA